MDVGEEGDYNDTYNYTYRYTVTTSCIKMGSDDSHFNLSLIVRDKVTRQYLQMTTFFQDKRESKLNRAEALLLTSLTPYRQAKPAHEPFCRQRLVLPRDNSGKGAGLWMDHWPLQPSGHPGSRVATRATVCVGKFNEFSHLTDHKAAKGTCR